MEQHDVDAVLDALADGPATAEALVQRLALDRPALAARGTQWLVTQLLRRPEIAYRDGLYERRAGTDDEIDLDNAEVTATAVPELDRSMARRYVVLDIETNADHPSPADHEIIELAAVRVVNGEMTETFGQLVRNTRPLADVTIETTGLRDEDLTDAPPLEPTLRQLLDFVGSDPLVAHNGFGFDFVVLDTQCARHDLPVPAGERLDTLDLAHVVFPRVGHRLLPDVDNRHPPENRQLEHLAKHLSVGGVQEHRALADVRLCMQVLDALIVTLSAAGAPGRLVAWVLQQGSHPWGAFLPPVDAPPSLVDVVPPPELPEAPPATGTFDVNAAVAPLDRNGVLLTGGRVRRPQQVQMARAVAEALAFDRQQLIEAPTGTGKTLAYLPPAISYARACGTPVVVAVHSKVLQNQILSELPELRPAFGDVRWVMLKGIQNYCDLDALDALLEAPPRTSDEALALAVLCHWVSRTPIGDWDDLHVWGLERRTPIVDMRWRLRLDGDGPPFDELGDRCFYQRSTRALAFADVAILNHAVMVSRDDWRDEAGHLILDEAHNLEEAATAAFSEEVTERTVQRLLNQVHDPATRWGTLARWLDATGTSARSATARRVLDARRQAVGAAHNFGTALVDYVRDRSDARREEVAQFGTRIRLQRGDTVRPSYAQVRAGVAGLADALRALAGTLDELTVPVQLQRRYRRRRLEREIGRTGRQLREAASLLYDIALVKDPDEWIALAELTIHNDRHRWGLRRSPLTAGPHLAELWADLDAVVLTSATLRVGRTSMYLQRSDSSRRLAW